MTIKETNNAKYLLLTALFMVILQGANLVGVAVNTKDIKTTNTRVEKIWADYIPMWFMEGMIKNMNYQTEEIVATIKGDESQVRKINAKYLEFQRMMINNLQLLRGGMTNITRSADDVKKERDTK